jgi:hypothetical protein
MPPNGTAGLARSRVKGSRRDPRPPAKTMANTSRYTSKPPLDVALGKSVNRSDRRGNLHCALDAKTSQPVCTGIGRFSTASREALWWRAEKADRPVMASRLPGQTACMTCSWRARFIFFRGLLDSSRRVAIINSRSNCTHQLAFVAATCERIKHSSISGETRLDSTQEVGQ